MVNAVSVAEIIRDVIQRALGDDAKSAPSLLPNELLLRWISEAYRTINRRIMLQVAEHVGDLLTQAKHDRPIDILDRLVTSQMALRIKSGSAWVALKERPWDYVRQLYPDLENIPVVEVPDSWAWDERDGELLILPPPAAGVTGGLKMDYVQDTGNLARLYDPDAATCAVTNGSAVVTFAASIAARVAANDVFGVKADAESLPTSWYRILSVDNATQLTLTQTFQGVTDSAALFTLSQVSPIEWRRPGLVRFAPSLYCLAKYMEREEGPDAAAVYYQGFDSEIKRIAADCVRPTVSVPGLNARKHYPALR